MSQKYDLMRLAMQAIDGDPYVHSSPAFVYDAMQWLARELGEIRIGVEQEKFVVSTDEPDAWIGKICDERLSVCLATAVIEVECRRNPDFAIRAERHYTRMAEGK